MTNSKVAEDPGGMRIWFGIIVDGLAYKRMRVATIFILE